QAGQPRRIVRDPSAVLASQYPREPRSPEADAQSEIHILVRTPQQLDAAIALRPSVERSKAAGLTARVASPRILKPGESRILGFLLSLDCAILVRSAGMLHTLQGPPHAALIGDFSLNTANLLTAETY